MPSRVIDRLYDLAEDQAGVFTAAQALGAGISSVALARALDRGEVRRALRGIYEVVRYPHSREMERWAAILFPTTQRADADLGVLSHETAIEIHLATLADIAPSRIHVTATFPTPTRREIPPTIALHPGIVPEEERDYTPSGVPVTNIARTIEDALATPGSLGYVMQLARYANDIADTSAPNLDVIKERLAAATAQAALRL